MIDHPYRQNIHLHRFSGKKETKFSLSRLANETGELGPREAVTAFFSGSQSIGHPPTFPPDQSNHSKGSNGIDCPAELYGSEKPLLKFDGGRQLGLGIKTTPLNPPM